MWKSSKNNLTKTTFRNEDTGDVSEILNLVLEEFGFEHQRIIKYVFTLEEALCKWRNTFPADALVSVEKRVKRNSVVLEIRLEGEKCNPIEVEDNGDDYTKFRNRILNGCGVEFRYFYQNGTNILRLKFPRKETEKKIFVWNLLAISIPIAMRTLLLAALTATDGFMLGFVSQEALSAVSVIGSFVTIYSLAFDAIAVGLGILTAQLWGKYDKDSVKEVLALSLKYGCLVSILFFVGGFFFPERIVGLYTTDPALIGIGAMYLKETSFAFLLEGFALLYGCILTNTGRVMKITMITVVAAGTNVILNALLIFGLFGLPKLGVTGAAIATNVATLIEFTYMIVQSVRDGMLKGIGRKIFESKSRFSGDFLKLIGTISLQKLSWGLSGNVITALFGHLGSDVLAARSLAALVSGLTISFALGFGQGAGVLIGNDLGRKQFEQAERKAPWVMKTSLKVGLLLIPVTFMLGLLAKNLPIELSQMASKYYLIIIIIESVSVLANVLNTAINRGFLYAGGETTYIFIIDTISCWGIIILGAALLIYVLKAPILLSIALLLGSEIVSLPFEYARYRKKRWLKNIA